MSDAFIVGGVRTPIGNLGGGLSEVRPDDLAAHNIAELMRKYPSVAPAGIADVVVAGGVESMTRAPYALSKGSKAWARDLEMFDTSLGWRFVNTKMKEKYGTDSMGQTAEN